MVLRNTSKRSFSSGGVLEIKNPLKKGGQALGKRQFPQTLNSAKEEK